MEKIEIRSYEGSDISFLLAGKNVKANATEMARVYGREVKKFMRTDSTKYFIESLKRSPKRHRLGIKKAQV